jgi:hypothetical protein
MTNNTAISLGFAAGIAIIGGVSLKFLKGRKAKVEERKSLKALMHESMSRKNYNLFLEELRLEDIPDKVVLPEPEAPTKLSGHVALVSDEQVEVQLRELLASSEPVSVSRMRAVVAPMFWTHFESNIRRLESVELTEDAFGERGQLDYTRGWHKCTMNGLNGIMHVTKQHVSAVVFDGKDFFGISTSNSRFNTRGLTALTHDRVKAYLQGH